MKRNFTTTRAAEIRSLDGGEDIELPLFAINWINTRSSKLYTTYLGLAGRLVRKINGEPVFKANTKETLAGAEASSRELLLIVRYPSAAGFLSLLVSRTFQLVSTLRVTAVRSFSFVFNKRLDLDSTEADQLISRAEGAQYAALMYASDGDVASELAALHRAAGSNAVSVDFFSAPTASLVLSRKGKDERPIPYVTDRVAILSADSVGALKHFAISGVDGTLGSVQNFWVGRMERAI